MKKIIILFSALISTSLTSKEINGMGQRLAQQNKLGQKVMANCAAPSAARELWINNVRTILFTGGDMWWDQFGTGNAYYIVPAVSNRANGVSSSFGGSIWLGGLDAGGQLKVAAMTYRQNGIDFWPGPLDITTASADPAECAKYDQLFELRREEVDLLVSSNGSNISANVANWPGNGNTALNQDIFLAPFHDANNDNLYDPAAGDYPDYDVLNKAEKDNLGFCKSKVYGDYTMFWVFNDKGGPHTETKGIAIGVEVRAQAFAFKTNDEVNNMTFYNYEIHNRSSFQLNQTYFTVWNDPDLGYFLDDYVGCDVKRGLGFIYNADSYDETAAGTNGYLDFPPALGCDFFKGPLADYDPVTGIGDGIDNDQDNGSGLPNSGIDEPGETIQMSRFGYYNNNYGAFPDQITNPAIAIHYYNFMTGFWKDGSPFTQGGNGYGGTAPATFVYDGDPVAGTGWTETSAGNLPGDRRFLQSAGPFTLKPGAVNNLTFGMPWAQSPSKGGNIASLALLKIADDKAQALFDNCFKLLDGPEAPDLTIQELNNELIVYLTNKKGSSNNYKVFNNDYVEADISIPSDPTSTIAAISNPDRNYRFEGYIVYQVKDDKVTSSDLTDATKAKIVFQCDVQNGVSRLINYELNTVTSAYNSSIKVDGADKGITSTFRVTEDLFSTSADRKLINNKTYYFLSVAYAYNNYLEYKQDVPVSVNPLANLFGQKRPYLEGRKNKKAAGIPHIIDTENGGTVAQSAYGFGPKITRIEGQGNGGNALTLTKGSELEIVNNFTAAAITYENGQGPINVKVVDPLNVTNSNFTFKFINTLSTATLPSTTLNVMPSAIPNATNNATGNGLNTAMLNVDNTSWELKDLNTGKTYYPNNLAVSSGSADVYYQTIKIGNEFYFPDLGFSINVKQIGDPGEQVNSFTNFGLIKTEDDYVPAPGAFIGAKISYENGTSDWLNPLKDADGTTPDNWIHSGNNKSNAGLQITENGNDDAFYDKTGSPATPNAFYDPQKQFGKILDGTWAPYSLCSSFYTLTPSNNSFAARVFGGPALSSQVWYNDALANNQANFSYYQGTKGVTVPDRGNTDIRKLSSALIVYTKDKSKWTRCVVLEMQEKANLSEGNAVFFQPRKHNSVDKQGIALGSPGCNTTEAALTATSSMGWFPGYAINLETGERLNMAFGEDSYQKENNGNDMKWNPTSNRSYPYSTGYALGGKHFVYVFGGSSVKSTYNVATSFPWNAELNGTEYGGGSYDFGAKIISTLNVFFNYFTQVTGGAEFAPINAIERDIMWVSVPMVKQGFEFNDPANMPSDVRIQINVGKPYRYGFSGVGKYASQATGSINKLAAVTSPSMLTTNISSNPQNNNFPLYSFNTSDIATLLQQASTLKNALDLIKVVPNPYYGSSAYETGRIDNRVRITNLPSKCTIKIFTMNGTLVRTIKRDVDGQEDQYTGDTGAGSGIKQSKRIPYQDWDLKNQDNISVASGLYIFYIDAPGIGEKIVKWFGVMRPLDVQNY